MDDGRGLLTQEEPLPGQGRAAVPGVGSRRMTYVGITAGETPELLGDVTVADADEANRHPTNPSAIVLPPLAVYAGALVFTCAVAVLAFDGWWSGGVARAALLAALHIPLLYCTAALTHCIRTGRPPDAILVPITASFALTLDLLLPGPRSPWPVVVVVGFLGYVAPWVAGAWRRRWERAPEFPTTLLVPSATGVDGLIHRLEAVPGVAIQSVLLPAVSRPLAETLIGKPVATKVVGPVNLERSVVVSCPQRDERVRRIVAQLVARGHEVLSESALLRATQGRVDSMKADPMSLLMSAPRHRTWDAFTRAQDFLAAGAGLVVLSPLFAAIALAIKLDSGGPVFFRQRRLGNRGRPFKVIKFRTMVHRAEAISGPVWAQENDPRITRTGRFLRRTRLDELPQLINVLFGQMGLVGPRPERPHFFRKLRADVPIFELRTAVRPGITGWAQIRAPYAAAVDDARVKLDHDLYYLTRRSPWFDLAILFDTVGVALGGKGAR